MAAGEPALCQDGQVYVPHQVSFVLRAYHFSGGDQS